MAKLRDELRKRLPPFNTAAVGDAYILLDAIDAGRWIDIEEPQLGEHEGTMFDDMPPELQERVRRWNEIQSARSRVVDAALVEYARLYTQGVKKSTADACRAMLEKYPGVGYWHRRERVRIKAVAGSGYNTFYEHEYLCKLCGVSIASLSSLAQSGGTDAHWRKLQRHVIRCACLLVVETHEQAVYWQRVKAGELQAKGRWKTEPPPARIECPPPRKS